MQPQIQVLTTCPHCDGEAYLPDELITSADGTQRLSYAPCPECSGFGRQKIWLALTDLLELLVEYQARDPLAPDWSALAHTRPAGHLQASLEDAGLY